MDENLKYDYNKSYDYYGKIIPLEYREHIKKFSKVKILIFDFNGKKYNYTYKSDKSQGLGYIFNEKNMVIYSAYDTNDNTSLGKYLDFILHKIGINDLIKEIY